MRLRGLVTLALGTAIVLVTSVSARGGIQFHEPSVGPGACSGTQSLDFDNNSSADLAVGVPGEDLDGKDNAGGVNVIYGSDSSDGLQADGSSGAPDDQFWSQGSAGLTGAVEKNDKFGRCVVAGDFNGDNYDDLAIGAPGEDVSGKNSAGSVSILYGTTDGLTAVSPEDQFFTQDSDGIPGDAQKGDEWGSALTAGDYDDDGFADLVVGAPLEDGDASNVGSINVIFGSAAGLTSNRAQYFTQASDGVADDAERDDKFGASLATGEVNDDTFDDLAVGVPEEDVDGQKDAGGAHVFFGSANGVTPVNDVLWTQNSNFVDDQAEKGDNFGWAVTLGDFDDNSFDDLAIGVPREDLDSRKDAGAVNVLYGTTDGVGLTDNDDFWNQDNTGAGDAAERFDFFGAALVSDDFNAAQQDEDLAVGVPGEKIDGHNEAGAVEVIYGGSPPNPAPADDGLHAPGQFISQNTAEVEDEPEKHDHFGLSLAAGSFDQDSFGDLAIGVPGENFGKGKKGAGAVEVIYAAPIGLSPTANPNDQFWSQDSPGVEGEAENNDLFGRSLG